MPSTLSAIHFLNFKKEHKGPMFQDPIRNLKATMNHAGLNERMLETDKYTPEVEEGDIIIFPSYLQHTVPAGKYN